MPLAIAILAAGQGTRMRSDLPKVLHSLAGRPLLEHVIAAARRLDPARLQVVYGYGGERVPERCAAPGIEWVRQAEQLGTGDAVARALPFLDDDQRLLVLYGDVPLIDPATLRRLVDAVEADGLALLTVSLDEPAGYGRIVRDAEGRVLRIVEQRDASPAEQAIREVNTGVMVAPVARLRGWLARLDRDNAQREYYLTDVVAQAVAEGARVATVSAESALEVRGVNSKRELAELERRFQHRRAEALLDAGATLADPARVEVRGELVTGRDVSIDVGAVFEGRVELGDRVAIGPYCVLRDVRIGDDSVIESHCVLERAEVGRACRVGPYARLRPETRLADRARVGNFVEVKKATIGAGSKVNHLSYVGDAELGRDVNVGAGTITCNYDGHAKHRTTIGDGAFIGSDTQLVAPVRVGDGATVGAGSTITRDVPAGGLTLSRTPQRTLPKWQRPGGTEDGER